MKQFMKQCFSVLLGALALSLFCVSCGKEDPAVYDQLNGEWVITDVAQSSPMTLRFYWHKGEMQCEVLGTQNNVTPDFGDGDGTYEVETHTNNSGVVFLEFEYETYEWDSFDEEYEWVDHQRQFVYNAIDNNTMTLTENYHLLASNDKSYTFIRR